MQSDTQRSPSEVAPEEIGAKLHANWGWIWKPPGPAEARNLLALRHKLLRGLVRIGGTEPVPAGVGPRSLLPLTEDDRLRILSETLAELRMPLGELQEVAPRGLKALDESDARATASEAIRLAFRLAGGYLGVATQAHENLGEAPVRSDLERESEVILEALGRAEGTLEFIRKALGDHASGLSKTVEGFRTRIAGARESIQEELTPPKETAEQELAGCYARAKGPIREVVALRREIDALADEPLSEDVVFENPGDMLAGAFRRHAGAAIREVAERSEEIARHLRGVGSGDTGTGTGGHGASAGTADARRAESARRLLTRDPVMLKTLINVWGPVRKVFVAVHGIGDQFRNATVQSVAFAVCRYLEQPMAIALGRFQGPGGTLTKAYIPNPASDPPINCGFAEIYWADVPRDPVDDAHILEAPTSWARGLVEKLRLRALAPVEPGESAQDRARSPGGSGSPASSTDRDRDRDAQLESLLEELIVGVNVTNRLLGIAEKAGVFRFDLGRLLDDYLNDVQVVTEFEDYRRQLLEIFDDVLSKLHKYLPTAQVYLVAHSEGTVVSFLGLLRGLHHKRAWTSRVRGLMTIGSPLNKHIQFWPEIFEAYTPPREFPPGFRPIRWKNYYDYGDPVGYDLAPTRLWMKTTGDPRSWFEFFKIEPSDADEWIDEALAGKRHSAMEMARLKQFGGGKGDDYGFSRYYFPGKAHNDYWEDPDVFGNFLKTVVDPEDRVLALPDDPDRRKEHEHRRERYATERPASNGFARFLSWTLPYVLASALLLLACYLLYAPVRQALDPDGARVEAGARTLSNLAGIWCLVAGMSLLGRIPRVSRGVHWVVLAFVLAAACGVGYVGLTADVIKEPLARFLTTGAAMRSRLLETPADAWGRGILPGRVTWAEVLVVLALLALGFHRWLDQPGRRSRMFWPRFAAGSFEAVMILLLLIGPGTRGFRTPDLDVLLCVSVLTALFLMYTARIQALKPLSWMVVAMAVTVEVLRWVGPVSPVPTPNGDANWGLHDIWQADRPSWCLVVVAFTLGVASWLVSRSYPKSGTRPLIHTTGLVLTLILATAFLVPPPRSDEPPWRARIQRIADAAAGGARVQLDDDDLLAIVRAAEEEDMRAFEKVAALYRASRAEPAATPRDQVEATAAMQQVVESNLDRGPVWPVLLGLPAFLYLWWLVVILFDLTFIWHLYIRYNGAQEYLLRQTLARLRRRKAAGRLRTAVGRPDPAALVASRGS
jgi:hypothetical protein